MEIYKSTSSKKVVYKEVAVFSTPESILKLFEVHFHDLEFVNGPYEVCSQKYQ